MPIRSLENLLNSGTSGRLEEIIQTAKNMGELTEAVRDGLKGDLAASIISASVRDDELILLCSSSAWAARLRFESDAMLAAAAQCGVTARRCQVKVSR